MEWRGDHWRQEIIWKLLRVVGSKWGMEGGGLGQGSDNGMERLGMLPSLVLPLWWVLHGLSLKSSFFFSPYIESPVTISLAHLLSPTAVRGIFCSATSQNIPTGQQAHESSPAFAGLSADCLPQREQFLIKYCLRLIPFVLHAAIWSCPQICHVTGVLQRWLGLQFSI